MFLDDAGTYAPNQAAAVDLFHESRNGESRQGPIAIREELRRIEITVVGTTQQYFDLVLPAEFIDNAYRGGLDDAWGRAENRFEFVSRDILTALAERIGNAAAVE